MKKSVRNVLFVGFLTFAATTNVQAAHYTGNAYNLFAGSAKTIMEVDTSNTDITDSLHNKLNTACTEGKGLNNEYIMVHVGNGNYTVTEKSFVLCSNVYLVLEPNTTITKTDGSNYSLIRTTNDSNTTNALIFGGKLNVNGKGKSNIELVKATNVTVKDVELIGGANNGMRIDASNNVNLVDVRIHDNNGYGIHSTNSNFGISTTGIWNNDNNGIYGNSKSVISVGESEIWGNKKDGISLQDSTLTSNGNLIYGNNRNGLYATKASTLVLKNSEVYSNNEYGIQIIDGSILKANDNGNNKIYSNNYSGVTATGKETEIYLHKNEITDNGVKPKQTADGAVGHGVGVSEGAYANITNNVISNNKECGISAFDGSKVKIVNNRIIGNGRHGIGARKNITIKEITDNTVSGNIYNGMLLADKTSGLLTGNTITENGNFGLSVVDKSEVKLNKNTITNNTSSNITIAKGDAKLKGAKVTLEKNNYIAYSVKDHGIAVSQGSYLIINNTGNKIERNKKNGLSVTSESNLKISAATTVYGNGESGIYIKNSDASIKSAKVRKNANHGVFINNGGNLDIWKSTVSQNGNYGINISGSNVIGKVSTNTIESNLSGVVVNKGATVIAIKNNKINSNKEFGVMIRAKSLVKEVNNNKIENNGEKGIFVNSAKVNKIMRNTINSNGEYGIMLMNGSTALDTYKNTISNHTKYGIASYSSNMVKVTSTNKYSNNKKKNYYVGV